MEINGAKMFVKALQEEGVDTLFAYPGGTAIDLFDALYDAEGIDMILPRHEQALVHAADGYARSTGRVGVCLVTSGPGATNLVTGIATANYDSVPLVCFTGQVPMNLIGNDAFQEVDIVGITRSICKYAVTVRKREDLARIIKNAFYIARTGKPGPVVVDIPKDIQLAMGSDEYPTEVNIRGYKPSEGVHVGQIKRALAELKNAKKPVFLCGGGVNIAHARKEMQELAEKTGIPVVTTIMGKGAIPTDHPLYVGNIGMHGNMASNKAIMESDVLFSIGCRFNDRITGTIDTFAKNAKIIHVDIDAASISRNIKVDIPIVADAKVAISKMLEYAEPLDIKGWVDDIMNVKAEYPINMNRYDGVTPEAIIRTINDMYSNLIVTTDVGQNQLWTTQYIDIDENKQLLTSGGLGTMGYGFPAAIGAKLGNMDKDVICISGDGGVQMNIQEMATAVVQEAPVIICVFNNYYLGMVRQMQQLFYGKRYEATCLRRRKGCPANCKGPNASCPPYTPDFIALAKSYGAHGIRVEREEDIQAALDEARTYKDAPTIIEFMIATDEIVLPMVKSGNPMSEMILK